MNQPKTGAPRSTKHILAAAAIACCAAGASAQSAIDAYTLSQTELRGTARFMSMAGAFTALGGDLSTLTQNPGGIGIYRGSDIGITFDLDMLNSTTSGIQGGKGVSNTHFNVNNAGYIGTINLGSGAMQTISWGVSYARLNSFNRQYSGSGMPMGTSLSNYITTFTDGYDPGALFNDGSSHNPYQDYSANAPNWLSILAFNGGLVTPQVAYDQENKPYETNVYDGLYQYEAVNDPDNPGQVIPATTGAAAMTVTESGHTDEYSLNLGGNVSNVLYWGVGLGITDMKYNQTATYSENLRSADVPVDGDMGITVGNGGFDMYNWKRVTGTGVNFKLGVILKPVNELRIGVAVHTPTYWSMTTSYNADVSSAFTSGFQAYEATPTATYDWRLSSPWKMMVGLAGVIGGRAIVSADWEYQGYNSMNTRDADGTAYDYFNDDVKNYFKASNTLRLGAEFRVTPQFSLRAGYSYTSSNVKEEVADNDVDVYTTGTNTAYTLDSDTQYVTCGLGYRTGGFYVDLAYIYKHRQSTYHAFSSFKDWDEYWHDAPSATVKDNNSSLVLTLGYKF